VQEGRPERSKLILTCDGEKQDRASMLTLAELQSVCSWRTRGDLVEMRGCGPRGEQIVCRRRRMVQKQTTRKTGFRIWSLPRRSEVGRPGNSKANAKFGGALPQVLKKSAEGMAKQTKRKTALLTEQGPAIMCE
jgi:hypothetical protein